MNAALSEIWTRDNQEGIRLANDVVNNCAALIGAATARQPAKGPGRLRRWAAGERWTPEMTKAYNDAMRDLARARKCYADHVRARFGLNAAELFTSAEADDKPKAIRESAATPPPALPAARRRPWRHSPPRVTSTAAEAGCHCPPARGRSGSTAPRRTNSDCEWRDIADYALLLLAGSAFDDRCRIAGSAPGSLSAPLRLWEPACGGFAS